MLRDPAAEGYGFLALKPTLRNEQENGSYKITVGVYMVIQGIDIYICIHRIAGKMETSILCGVLGLEIKPTVES